MIKPEIVKGKKLRAGPTPVADINCEEFYGLVLKSSKPVIVSFWADWCAACHTVKPIVEKLASKYKEHLKFYSINADACQSIASTYQVTSLPTLIIYYQGNSVERLVGESKMPDYENFIDNAIIRLNN
ncbi:MAG: thioredoxin family protein [Deltaproteobacteria bacterium]|nr:thioredoxin family protein [Deltaproteobacteria bacterium]MCL5276777.1 thioredoxin family protein [Deltaproteobacteria bacterium]